MEEWTIPARPDGPALPDPCSGVSLRLPALLLALVSLACALLVFSAPAFASPFQFGTEGEGAGQFLNPTGIALNQATGDVYVVDKNNNRVDEFSGEGSFVRTWGWGVRDNKPEFEVCEAPGPCFPGLPGTGGGQFFGAGGVAVDNSLGLTNGDVYVEDASNRRVERFSATGEFILTFGGEVNKDGEDVCLAGEECQAGTSGSGPGQFEALGRNAIAVSSTTGLIYVGDSNRVQKFSAGGSVEGEIPLGGAGIVELLALDSTGDIYVLSSALTGIHEYDGTGSELGSPRDPGLSGSEPAITVGSGDELFVSDAFKGQILEYDATGAQIGSFALIQEEAAGGIALDESTRTLYVIHQRPVRVVIQQLPKPGPAVVEQTAGEVLPTSATLQARVNPEEPASADGKVQYHFEYGTTEAYGSSTPVKSSAGEPFEDRPVSAAVEGLQPRTLYHFRVVVTNAAAETTAGPDQTFETLPPVSIDSQSAAAVTANSAKLIAELNPHGLPSEYHFEYGLTSSYEKSAPIPDASAGQGSVDATFTIAIQALQPHTVYHYRVVAHNSLGVVQGSDQTFTTQGGEPVGLPDGRGYELVSPADKHGVSLEAMTEGGGVIEAAKEGGALTYFALGAIDEEPAGSRTNKNQQILARRTAAGVWSTEDLATPHQAPAGVVVGDPSEYKLFSEDLTRGAVEPFGATPLSPATSEPTPYLREADGAYRPLVTGCPPVGEPCKASVQEAANVPAGTKFGGAEQEDERELFVEDVEFVTGTPDLRHVLLRSPTSLVEGFETGEKLNDYEWSEGKLTAVSLIPAAGGAQCGGAGTPCVPASEEGFGGQASQIGNGDSQVRGAISGDGNRVFFRTVAKSRLYVRDLARNETLRADAAEAGLKPAEGAARFQLANSDGSKVFFTDANKLTKDSTATNQAPDLYECEVVIEAEKLACKLHDLSVDDEHLGESADVQGVAIGASVDARYVYFVAKGALEPNAAQGNCPAPSEGQCVNLYAYDTVAHSRSLMAVLSEADAPDWNAATVGDLGAVTSRVSPDGHYVAFMSKRPLTGYDNRDAHSSERDEEVFLYHAANPGGEAGTLTCASCDPTGQRPVGVLDESLPGPLIDRARVWNKHWLAASIPGWTKVDFGHALHQPRYLADSGRLFFNSPQSLVAADGNGTQDVYQYEPNGVGNCTEPSGCVALISSGTSSEESVFLDASENGDDAFLMTTAQLSGVDQDNAFDIYDAHVCSDAPGCPAPVTGTPPPCASTDACRAAPAAQPDIFGAPASQTFNGQGNLTPPPATKAKAPTRAQLLAKALHACHTKHNRHKRKACERQAHKRYGAAHKARKSAKRARRS